MAAIITPFDTTRGHSISNVLIVFDFGTPIAPHALTDLRVGGAFHERLKEGLPRVVEKKQMTLNLEMGPSPQVVTSPVHVAEMIGGISFSRVKPDGEPAFSVNIENNSIFIIYGEYDRWEGVSREISHYLDILSPWLRSFSLTASSLSLRYTDTFKVVFDDGGVMPLTDLFNRNSRYLPPNIGMIDEAFHSHHGFFSKPEFDLDGRILTNINANVNRAVSHFDVNIVTLHKYQLSRALPFIQESGELDPSIVPAFKYLHDQSKAVFGDVITEQAKDKIRFNSQISG